MRWSVLLSILATISLAGCHSMAVAVRDTQLYDDCRGGRVVATIPAGHVEHLPPKAVRGCPCTWDDVEGTPHRRCDRIATVYRGRAGFAPEQDLRRRVLYPVFSSHPAHTSVTAGVARQPGD